jgi:hypothetical protein
MSKYDDDQGVVIHHNHRHITDKSFIYINDVSTDVVRTFRKFGWVPPSELKRKQQEEEKMVSQYCDEK